MPRSLAQWLDYQSRLHPKDIELGLDRVREVWRSMGAPAPGARVVTVSGTNGKGSSIAFLEQVLRAAGYRTGCYTSPHLLRYNERIRIDGDAVSDEMLCDAFEQIELARGDIPLTYFEYGTLAAIQCIARAGVNVAILEVGLGGRLDAVNIIDADVGLITGIALDHTDWLGDDLEQIGYEKAGIARAGRPLICAARQVPGRILDHARRIGARPVRLGFDYDYEVGQAGWSWRFGDAASVALPLPRMRGAFQLQNAAGALAALHCLPETPLGRQPIREGLLRARVAGRFDIRQRRCRWILDVAHNPQAAGALAAQLADLPVSGTRHAVVGMLGDKALTEVLALMDARVDRWHLLDLSAEPRGASAVELRNALPRGAAVRAHAWPSMRACLDWLDRETDAQDQVLVFGSFVTVGQAMAWLETAEPV
jgi:dihydrofolate synthase/folylpolyglutamate synthase